MKLCMLYLVVALFVIGCSSSSDNKSSVNAESEFEGRWVFTDYTLDDGTKKNVPEAIQDEGAVGISASSEGIIGVQSGLCDFYQISYVLDNDVLTTSDLVAPEDSCTGFYSDADNAERSELMGRTFLNSQTLIVVSGNKLTVTTMQNEQLNFERSIM